MLNRIIRITGNNISVEKSRQFCYNLGQRASQSLLVLRPTSRCKPRIKPILAPELRTHLIQMMLLILPDVEKRTLWHLHNLPTICSSSKKLPMKKRKDKTMHSLVVELLVSLGASLGTALSKKLLAVSVGGNYA